MNKMVGPLPYIGGKNRLAKKIISLFPEHTTYVEPFAGGAQVFFHKEPSKVEILNDLDFDIVNFFRVCQWHLGELVRQLNFTVASRKWFDILLATKPETLTDIQRAARFFYLQKNCFGGRVTRRNFHYGIKSRPNFNPKRIPEILKKTHDRLQGVQIESLPYGEILQKYDRKTTLFYLDPPYWGRELYRFNFQTEDFERLAGQLSKIKGTFILSLNDHQDVRRLFRTFKISTVLHSYTAQRRSENQYRELLIMN